MVVIATQQEIFGVFKQTFTRSFKGKAFLEVDQLKSLSCILSMLRLHNAKYVMLFNNNFHWFLDGVKVFAEFLRSEYSEENINFWLACEHFKSLKGNKIGKSAQKIHQLFIEVCSASEVS